MSMNFPPAPTLGQQHPTVNPIWEYNGTGWDAIGGSGVPGTATPVTRRLPSIDGNVDFIGIDGTGPALVASSVIATYAGGSPPPSAPAVMTTGQWTLAPIAGGLRFGIVTAPAGTPTSYQYSTDNGATWTTLSGGAALGTRDITGLAQTPFQSRVRGVNAVGPAPLPGSDTKTETPLAGGGGGGALVVDEGASTGVTFRTVNIEGTNYRLAEFTASGNLVVTTAGVADAALLVAAGGAGGPESVAGGGGGGGVRRLNAISLAATTYAVTIGAGGVRPTNITQFEAGVGDGGNTVFATYTANGGGCGGARDLLAAGANGRPGGCGGGAGGFDGGVAGGAGNTPPVAPSQGFGGGVSGGDAGGSRAGGGGGAGGVGGAGVLLGSAGAGGIGVLDDITGTPTRYGGGGGGGGSGAAAPGGAGGGGSGGAGGAGAAATAGTSGFGGGGGGGGHGGQLSANGGSGQLIVRWAL